MLKIGVIGTGHLGKFHLNNWQEIQNVEVIGFFDPSDANAQEVEAFREAHFDRVEYFEYLQWHASTQLGTARTRSRSTAHLKLTTSSCGQATR